jgi:hypothetical protein
MSPLLAGTWAKIKRAKKHIADLDAAIKSFNNSNPHRIGTKDDPQTRQKVFYLAETAEIPTDVALIAGDALHNLRSALDHLAMQLHLAGKFRPNVAADKIEFPFWKSAEGYKAGFSGVIKGSAKGVEDAIDALKPYQGGDDDLWAIHHLDIIDKHRLLLAAVCRNPLTSIGFPFEDAGGALNRWHLPDNPLSPFPSFVQPEVLYPLVKGKELLRINPPCPEIEKQVNFIIDVAFAEPQIVEGKAVVPFLTQLSQLVDNIVAQLGGLV